MPDKIKEELLSLYEKLCTSTFTGIGISKYYPEGSQTAYYRMEYSPGKLVVKHKSPWDPREERFEVKYRSAGDCNYASIEIYTGEKLDKRYSEKNLEDNLDADEGLRLMNKCGFHDPRWMLQARRRMAKGCGQGS